MWKYHHPKFEFEKKSLDKDRFWGGHVFFAYDLVSNTKPNTIVELGTHIGTSFFSFCQAAKDHSLKTKLFAVDTWKGDKHAGFYGESVYNSVLDIQKNYYEDLDINLLKMTFDEALSKFADASIDLLHIDGLHTYEAVKHDFEAWLPKVKDDGIVLFHDIAAIGVKDFGVYKLWDELKNEYKTIEFRHCGGLGILFKKSDKFQELFKFEDIWKNYYTLLYENDKLKLDYAKNKTLLANKEEEIEFIKSSKFWKLRGSYLKMKFRIKSCK